MLAKIRNLFQRLSQDHDWCKDFDSNGEMKDITLFYKFYFNMFWPHSEKQCWCCAGRRGILIGIVLTMAFFFTLLHFYWRVI